MTILTRFNESEREDEETRILLSRQLRKVDKWKSD